jgi:antitoxin component of MazEF toxin-antitoxin module
MIYISSIIQGTRECAMQVSKWGNSLAVRLPRAVVEALKLRKGDDIEIIVAGNAISYLRLADLDNEHHRPAQPV